MFEEAGPIDEQGDEAAQQEAKSGSRKGAQGKALEHFIDRNHQPTEPEADDAAQQPAMRVDDIFLAHLADGKTTDGAQGEEQDANDPESHAS